mmetsp:Transcript_11090/g.14004  ORF Transcript_11090/g.14004 Transcript_11090/m.14004 type:complete len:141 (+) Transcript_11090:115-537(+)
MVFYECVVTTRNTASFKQLTNLVKTISHKVVENGGIVRSIQNHGIRSLPHRFKAKYTDREGNRYYEKGRFFSVFYDSGPGTKREVDNILTMDEQVLRKTHFKVRNKLWYVNIAREDKNPYIKQVLAMEEEEKKKMQDQSE